MIGIDARIDHADANAAAAGSSVLLQGTPSDQIARQALRRDAVAGGKDDISLHEERLAGDAGTTPEHRLLLADVWDAIAGLAVDQREVLLLVCVEEFSYREAADILGIPIGTVMSRLARARANIAAATGIDVPAGRSQSQNKVASDE